MPHGWWRVELETRLISFDAKQLNRSLAAMKAARRRRGRPINKETLIMYRKEYKRRGISMPK